MNTVRKTQKIMDLHICGYHVECIQHIDKTDSTPLRVYRYWNGSRKQVGKFACLVDVLTYLRDVLKSGMWKEGI